MTRPWRFYVLGPSARHAYLAQDGRPIYEWDQTVDEVNVYITPPEGVTGKSLAVSIASDRVSVGIKGNPPYLDCALTDRVVPSESTWTFEGGELSIELTKAARGKNWACVFAGHAHLDAMASQKEQERLMLERFQEENPGFDFSQAEFNGAAPKPNEFMGGMGAAPR